jgi:hypothetical protein
MNRKAYALHRWLSLAALVQLLVWTSTGLFFAVTPIARVRGEDRLVARAAAPIPWEQVGPLPADALAGVEEATVRVVDGRAVVLARGPEERRFALDAATGRAVAFDAAAAERIARADQAGSPRALAVVAIHTAPLEYRGGEVPAWRVDLDDGRGTRVYVDAATGAIGARRNGLWRAYDFLWALHIMDYGGREDFNSPWLVLLAALGLATALSGTTLWVLRAARRVRR